jgi:hypothetical protein
MGAATAMAEVLLKWVNRYNYSSNDFPAFYKWLHGVMTSST